MSKTPVGFARHTKGKSKGKVHPIFSATTGLTRGQKAARTRRLNRLKRQHAQQAQQVPPTSSRYLKQWRVPSQSSPGTFYKVSLTRTGEWQCSCPAWIYRHTECKHIRWAKAHPTEGNGATEPEVAEPIRAKGDFKHPMESEEPKPPPKVPDEVTIENYHKVPVPSTGPVGKKYAPLIHWDKIQERYQPPTAGSVDFYDYSHDDAPKGILPELREAFERNRQYVTQGKDPVNVMLQGPAGTGKTIAVKKFAEDLQLPYYYVPAEPAAMTSEQLLGRKEIEVTPEGQQTVWHDGTIVKAARTGGILHIEEFSLLDPEVTPRLHELFDASRRISLEGLSGEVVQAHPDLFVIITLNPAELGIAGVKPLSQPIRRRFRGIYMDYPPLETEMRIIKRQLKLSDDDLKIARGAVSGDLSAPIHGFMKVLKDLRARSDELTYMPTASEAVDFGRELKAGATVREAAHRALIGKFVGEERNKIKESVKFHLGAI